MPTKTLTPQEKDFFDEYETAQQVWPETVIPWKRLVEPDKHASNPEDPTLYPEIPFESKNFQGKELQKQVGEMQRLFNRGHNFIVLKPDDVKPGAGWKTFIIALREEALRHGYDVLHTWDAAMISQKGDHGYMCYNFNRYELLFFVDKNKGLDKSGDVHLSQEAEQYILDANTNHESDKKFIVITTPETLGAFASGNIESKMRRLSVNGKGGLPTFTYPKLNWLDILRQRIDTTEVNLKHVLLADKILSAQGIKVTDSEGKPFEMCQKGQEEATKRLLKILYHVINGRVSAVLAGAAGCGKSHMLIRCEALLNLAAGHFTPKDRTGTRICRAPRFPIAKDDPIERKRLRRSDIVFVDDDVGCDYENTENNVVYGLAVERIPFLGATNIPYSTLKKYTDKLTFSPFIRTNTPRDPFDAAHPCFRFSYCEAIDMPGEDYFK